MFHASDVRLKLSTLLEGVSSPDKISKSLLELPRNPSWGQQHLGFFMDASKSHFFFFAKSRNSTDEETCSIPLPIPPATMMPEKFIVLLYLHISICRFKSLKILVIEYLCFEIFLNFLLYTKVDILLIKYIGICSTISQTCLVIFDD